MALGLGNNLIRSGGAGNADKLSLDLQFAADKTLTARKGPTPTFLRASGATQVNAAGLIEYAPENLFLRSEDFSNSVWSKLNGPVFAGKVAGPVPDSLADRFTVTAGSTIARIEQTVAVQGTVTFSIWMRADAPKTITVTGIGSNIVLNLTTSWTRFAFTRASVNMTTTPVSFYIGNDVTPFEVYGAQLERSSTARAYIPTTTAAVYGPRFDHDPVTLACEGLLIEEQRINSVADSNAFNNWSTTNSSVASSSVANPEGSLSAWKVKEDMLLGIHTVTRSFTAVSGTTYTASVWLKAAENGFAFVGLVGGGFATFTLISVDLSTGAVTTATGTLVGATSVAHSNGWWRVSISQVATSSASSNIDIRLSRDGVFANRSYLGNGVNGMYVYGAQVEAGSFPTSYIPTTTAAVTRSADVCSITSSTLWNAAEGTLFSAAIVPTGGFEFYSTNWLNFFGHRRAATNAISAIVRGGGTFDVNLGSFVSGNLRVASTHGGNLVSASFNGGSVISTIGTLVLNPTVLAIGYSGSTSAINGHVSSLRYYRKRLSNAKLQTLTT